MAHPQWQQAVPTQSYLSGNLDRESVPGLWHFLKQLKTDTAQLNIDMSGVNRVDSAGMVMLIHLIEHAKKQNCHIMLSVVPDQLRTLCQLSNVESLLFPESEAANKPHNEALGERKHIEV
ncbi:putative Sulphate transporter/antisigma-factor antagonist STAS [Vibrio nigripulchritudo SFn27]|uniref:Putative Sulphate transporter/antisigma-factor antagonist STAS n=1 Tax=Vibrio nigripulchritudo TaxID=28173 RepID=U4K8R8_9VIBR|nr:lipid asymmetry maintenance protein MlaB [Vibrio nigripulchritudo]CCN87671.1 putative Sulphate transporter/antisigma-factor antagonist STAS [Vibrio nigripulchritudo SFn27]CCN95833.1 putative Sulphate transporter/antisigma-factor antagonist STAS [Vibrio nigripulchritudo ENn2]CCO38991.1 putative Sulphate transporter/antisigma-factor antagonist STAS [Vibrio nigripulchritudo SFn135]CCO51950.1 putative Sulphate transporter/antisigma-factor antagonist STAS [Vibrio nigripulchritudo Wn13]CCO58996.1